MMKKNMMKKNMKKDNIVVGMNNGFRGNAESIEEALHMVMWGGADCFITVNGILMPDLTDETFFYASVKAAKKGLVWCEMKHQFVEQSYLSDLLGGCFDTGDPADDAQFWAEAVANVSADIHGIFPVTGDSDGFAEYAIVKDEDLAEECRDDGRFIVTQIGTDPEDGTAIYRVELAEWDEDDDCEWEPDYEEPEEVVRLTGSAAEVKPFVKAVYRAIRHGKICWSGFCDAPRLNADRRYRVTLWKERWGYYLTTEVVKTITDPSGDFFWEDITEWEALDENIDHLWDLAEDDDVVGEITLAEEDDKPVIPTTRYNRFGKFGKSRWCRRPANCGFTENCTTANKVYVGGGMAEGVICRY